MSGATTPNGPAITPDETLADMPRDLAHSVNHELLKVLALLKACDDAAGSMSGGAMGADKDGVSDTPSRLACLIQVADDKVRAILGDISPYV